MWGPNQSIRLVRKSLVAKEILGKSHHMSLYSPDDGAIPRDTDFVRALVSLRVLSISLSFAYSRFRSPKEILGYKYPSTM